MTARLYAYIALAVLVLGAVGAIYAKGRIDAAHKQEVQRLKDDLQKAKDAAEREANARKQDAIIATENAKRKAVLEKQVAEMEAYVDTLEDRDSVCLSTHDVDRLRNLWR